MKGNIEQFKRYVEELEKLENQVSDSEDQPITSNTTQNML